VCAPLLSRKIVKPFRLHLFLSNHLANCPCDCDTCSEKKCYGHKLVSDFLCIRTKAQLLHGSEHSYHCCWECLPLKCEKCFLNKPSVLLCERSAFDDPSVTMKWEQWDTMDYSRHNLVGTGPFPLDPQQQQGIPLRFISPSLLFGQIIVQNSFFSRYQLCWSVLNVNKTTLDVIHLCFFCPQHSKGPPYGLGGNCKNAIRVEEKFRRHLPAAIGVFLWFIFKLETYFLD